MVFRQCAIGLDACRVSSESGSREDLGELPLNPQHRPYVYGVIAFGRKLADTVARSRLFKIVFLSAERQVEVPNVGANRQSVA
jgi:hypothetical protein